MAMQRQITVRRSCMIRYPSSMVLAIKTRYLLDMILCLSDVTLLINVEKDEVLLTDNLHPGFVELYNDGEASSLRIFYLENGERRLERECTQISGLERAEDCSSLVFRICKLKSGTDCNEHVLIKPERSKDCHTIYYAFRYLQQKRTG
ncbi:hypothetical protein QQG55_13470 [Brugia pahangi]